MSRRIYLAIGLMAALCQTTFAQTNEVNVYSYRQPFLIEPIFAAFTEQTGIEVNVVFAKKGLVERLKHEGLNSPADIILTSDIGRLSDAQVAGVTQTVDSDTLNSNIPAQYRDPSGQWFGLTTRARILVASKDRIGEAAPARYEDLADPLWKGRICSRSGKHVYNVALLASMIAHDGEEHAEQWLTGLKDNLARKPQGNDRAQVKAIKEGVCDLALINHYYMGNMLADPDQVAWAEAVRIIFPNQEDRGTHVNISGVSLTVSAPDREQGIALMEFLSGDLAQQMYADQNFEYPVKEGVAWPELLQSWGPFKVDSLPLAELAKHRKAAIEMVDRVGFDG